MAKELPGWRVTLMLADSAQAVAGKLYILGGGWDRVFAGVQPSAIAIVATVPWDETNQRHTLKLALLDGNGQPVKVPTPKGEEALAITMGFEIGRPPGATKGQSFNVPLAVNMGPLPLASGIYEWRCTIDDVGDDVWRLPFECMGQVQPGQLPPPYL